MISRKIMIIVIACLTIGIFLIGSCIVGEWYLTSEVTFRQWIVGASGIRYILGLVGSFASSLVSASVFLIGVEFIIEKTKNQEDEERRINILRDSISKEMRVDSKKCLEKLNFYENKEALLINQFFAGCDFGDMTLDGENFSGTNFEGACFTNASMIGANLTGCILIKADLKNAKLSYADFTNASIDILTLEQAHSLWKAKMPNGSYYDGRYNLIGDIEMAKKMGYDLSDMNQFKQFYELE